MNHQFAFLRRIRFVLPSLIALLLLTTAIAHADTTESFNFSGTLVNSFNGSNSVTGSFTLDITNGTLTAFNFTTPIGQINATSGWSAGVFPLTATSPNADFVDLFFSGSGDMVLLFETTLTSFSGNTFFTAPITLPGGSNVSRLDCVNALPSSSCFGFASLFTSGGATPVSTVPEPSSILLLGTGLVAIAGTVRRKLGR